MAGRTRQFVDRIWSLPTPLNYFIISVFLVAYLVFLAMCTLVNFVIALIALVELEVSEWRSRSSHLQSSSL